MSMAVIGRIYSYTDGSRHTVIMFTNIHIKNGGDNPPSVTYKSLDTGHVCSRPLSEWEAAFTHIQ